MSLLTVPALVLSLCHLFLSRSRVFIFNQEPKGHRFIGWPGHNRPDTIPHNNANNRCARSMQFYACTIPTSRLFYTLSHTNGGRTQPPNTETLLSGYISRRGFLFNDGLLSLPFVWGWGWLQNTYAQTKIATHILTKHASGSHLSSSSNTRSSSSSSGTTSTTLTTKPQV